MYGGLFSYRTWIGARFCPLASDNYKLMIYKTDYFSVSWSFLMIIDCSRSHTVAAATTQTIPMSNIHEIV